MARAQRNIALSGQGGIGSGGALGGSANTSGDLSGTLFQFWKVTTYFLQGIWKRFWQYGTEPTYVGGNEGTPLSACPVVAGNYVTMHGQVTVNVKKVQASFNGGWWQPLGLTLLLEDFYNTVGGYSVSGGLTTSQVGETRVTWNDTTDVESYCSEPFTSTLSVQDGVYNAALDTSATFTAELVKALYDAKAVCPNFDPDIVAG
tara:strand:- start:645 stop:1253 length:609 start_codon:yes stop_codon:yes gene_type:complete